jgi:hypothetical protein
LVDFIAAERAVREACSPAKRWRARGEEDILRK